MSVTLQELLAAIDRCLEPAAFNDYCPNGLQVEGRRQVGKIVTGVTACQALLEQAIAAGADAILVHHGYFWKGEPAPVVGMKKRRLATLLQHDVSLLAYHLPLDAHPELGNNAQLAQRMGWQVTGGLEPGNPRSIGLVGRLPQPLTAAELGQRLATELGRAPLHIAGGSERIETLAWCTGAAQGYIEQAVVQGVDAYITGEVSEPTVHLAREQGIHFFSAGHHATERFGVQALGQHLAHTLGIEHQFIDVDNPV